MRYTQTCFLAVLLLLCAGARGAEEQKLLAVVGEEVITTEAPVWKLFRRFHPDAGTGGDRSLTVDSLIRMKLMAQEAKGMGIEIHDEEVESELKREGRGRGLEDLMAIRRFWVQHGITLNELRLFIRDFLFAEKFRRYAIEREKPVISPSEMRKFYEEQIDRYRLQSGVRFHRILIDTEKHPSLEKALEEAQRIRGILAEGKPFEETAKEVSDDPSAESNGGAIDWTRQGAYRAEVEKVLYSIEPGEVSEPIPDGRFIWIVRVDERENGKTVPFENADVQAEIREYLTRMHLRERENRILEKLREKVYVWTADGS